MQIHKNSRRDEGASTRILRFFYARPLHCIVGLAFSLYLVQYSLSENGYYGHDLTLLLESSTTDASNLRKSESIPNRIHRTGDNAIEPISCSERLANRKHDVTDPNKEYDESPKKYVNATDPQFWISLHDRHFDKMRWPIYNGHQFYEVGVTDQFKAILHSRERKGLVIDVGMNIGWFTVYSRAMGHKVVGFDPNPIMHTRVCESLQLNGWLEDSSVKTWGYGLGEAAAVLNITTGQNPGGSSFFEERLAKRLRKKLQVPVARLDDVAEQQGWITNEEPIYLWKLDVEGYEYHVLEGAQKLLHSKKVENILMENANKDLRQVVDMYATIYHAGFEVQRISDRNGQIYHEEMVPKLNKQFQEISPEEDLSGVGEDIQVLAKLTCNLWWKRRETAK